MRDESSTMLGDPGEKKSNTIPDIIPNIHHIERKMFMIIVCYFSRMIDEWMQCWIDMILKKSDKFGRIMQIIEKSRMIDISSNRRVIMEKMIIQMLSNKLFMAAKRFLDVIQKLIVHMHSIIPNEKYIPLFSMNKRQKIPRSYYFSQSNKHDKQRLPEFKQSMLFLIRIEKVFLLEQWILFPVIER